MAGGAGGWILIPGIIVVVFFILIWSLLIWVKFRDPRRKQKIAQRGSDVMQKEQKNV